LNEDFLTNVESVFLALFETDSLLALYNWQKWDSDSQVELPRGVITIDGRHDPEGSAIFRLQFEIRFEGRPKKARMSVVMNQLKTLLTNTAMSSLNNAKVNFFGSFAEDVAIRRTNIGGLRGWHISFTIFAVPMV
jgi:hypothetical protein